MNNIVAKALNPTPLSVKASVGNILTSVLTGFILIFTMTWLILYSFKPRFVRAIEDGESSPAPDANADPARCFIASVIIALLLIAILWAVKALLGW